MELTAEKIRFKENLNNWVQCSNNVKKDGVVTKEQKIGIEYRFISLNQTYKHYLAFDIDRKNSVYDWDDLNCPQPTIITRNPESKHCQYLYELDKPVICTPNARKRPQQYLEAIWKGLNHKLQGDLGYTRYMVRNPLTGITPVTLDKKYQLVDLQEYLKLDLESKIQINDLGRNSTLFDSLRLEGYKLSKNNLTRERLYNELLYVADTINSQFEIPLRYNELTSTCKSVSKWIDLHYIGDGIRRGVELAPVFVYRG